MESCPLTVASVLGWISLGYKSQWPLTHSFNLPFLIMNILTNYHVTLKLARLRHKCRIIGRYMRLDFIWCCLLIFIAVVLDLCDGGERKVERSLVRQVDHHQSSTSTWRTYLSLEMCCLHASVLLLLLLLLPDHEGHHDSHDKSSVNKPGCGRMSSRGVAVLGVWYLLTWGEGWSWWRGWHVEKKEGSSLWNTFGRN